MITEWGKSIKPLLEGKVAKIHRDNEIIPTEMFGISAVLMGEWKLCILKQDIRETTDLSKDHRGILQKMVCVYDKWAQDTGIIEPQYSEQQRN